MNIISILGCIYMKKVRFLESKKLIAVIMSLSLVTTFLLANSYAVTDINYDKSEIILTRAESKGKWIKGSNGKWWYKHYDGTYTKNDWEKIGGYWYYFDESGWMVTGWKKVNGDWYYFNQYGEGSEGQMRTGTMYKNGKKYVFNKGGSLYITELDVSRVRQARDKWCWAAASESVGGYNLNNYRDQYDIVNYIKGSSSINEGGTNDEIMRAINYSSMNMKSASVYGEPFSFSRIVSSVDSLKPFVIIMRWNSGKGHAIVCSGYNSNNRLVYCVDPWEDTTNTYYSYSDLVNGTHIETGTGTFEDTIYY